MLQLNYIHTKSYWKTLQKTKVNLVSSNNEKLEKIPIMNC